MNIVSKILAKILVGIVAALRTWFLILEMFLWTKPIGLKTFSMTAEAAEATATLAANQGLYNGFLVAGLLWGLFAKKRDVTVFFLACVIVAGVYGATTAKFSILFIQALPAALALGLTLMSSGKQDKAGSEPS